MFVREGEDYSIHLISKGLRPFGTPLQQARTEHALTGGARGAEPRLVGGGTGECTPPGGYKGGNAPFEKLLRIKSKVPLPRQSGALFAKSLCVGGGRGWGMWFVVLVIGDFERRLPQSPLATAPSRMGPASPYGGRYVPVARCPAAGLRSRSGRSWTRPTGAQDPSRQARRCRRRRRKGVPGRFPSPTPALGKIPSPLAMGGRSVV